MNGRLLPARWMLRRRREGSHHVIQLRTAPLRRASKWLGFYAVGSWTRQLERLEQLLGGAGPKEDLR